MSVTIDIIESEVMPLDRPRLPPPFRERAPSAGQAAQKSILINFSRPQAPARRFELGPEARQLHERRATSGLLSAIRRCYLHFRPMLKTFPSASYYSHNA